MFNFFEFYAHGGVFMHAISLAAVLAITALFLDARARKLGDDDPKRLRLADRLLVLCLGLGLIGSVTGAIDMFAALGSIAAKVSPAEYRAAFAHGAAIVPTTLAWALLVSIPLWIAGTIQRHRAPKPSRQTPA